MEEEKIISLKFYDSIINAEVDKDLLVGNEIECRVNTDTMVGVYPIFDNKERGIELLVFEKDKERAEKILEEYQKTLKDERTKV